MAFTLGGTWVPVASRTLGVDRGSDDENKVMVVSRSRICQGKRETSDRELRINPREGLLLGLLLLIQIW